MRRHPREVLGDALMARLYSCSRDRACTLRLDGVEMAIWEALVRALEGFPWPSSAVAYPQTSCIDP